MSTYTEIRNGYIVIRRYSDGGVVRTIPLTSTLRKEVD